MNSYRSTFVFFILLALVSLLSQKSAAIRTAPTYDNPAQDLEEHLAPFDRALALPWPETKSAARYSLECEDEESGEIVIKIKNERAYRACLKQQILDSLEVIITQGQVMNTL